MKLILKRLPRDDTAVFGLDGAERASRPGRIDDNRRPLALFTEDGELLPCQTLVITESMPDKCPTVTVTFYLDGRGVKLVGDE